MVSDISSSTSLDADSKDDNTIDARKRKLPLRTKLAFSSGAFQEAMVGAAGITIMVLYNQILGVSPKLLGLAFLIAAIVDAISDPMVGALSDRVNTRWGRRHPFMLISAFPLAVAFYFLYQPMEGLSETGYFLWLVGFTIVMRLSITFYNIPHDALGAEFTDDYDERTSLFGWNSVVGAFASVAMAMVVLILVFPTTPGYDNGLENPNRYPLLAIAGAVIAASAILVCTFGTRDRIPFLHQTSTYRPSLAEYLRNLAQLVLNRSYLAVCVSWLTLATALGILAIVANFTYLYGYSLSTEELAIAGWAKLPGIIVALPLTVYLTRHLDKKKTFIVASLISASLIALPHLLMLFGIFPNHESTIFFLVVLFGPLFLGYMILPVMGIVVDSQLVDICDDHEYRTGVRAEGVVFSIRTFAMKSTIGLGGLIGGFGLDIIGFPEDAVASELEPEVINGLLIMSGPLYLVVTAIGVAFMLLYRLNSKRHAEILAVLDERRAAVKQTQ
jgi:Na+/melibiose symporter-like transporter